MNIIRRSWSPHSLAVMDMVLINSSPLNIRVLTCSLDRALVLYDVHPNRQVLRLGLPEPLESVCINGTESLIFAGSSSGVIYCVNLAVAFLGIVTKTSSLTDRASHIFETGTSDRDGTLPVGVTALTGHVKAVTSMSCSLDNSTLVSVSADGSMKWWDISSGQCIRDMKPLNKFALSNVLVRESAERSSINEPF